MPGGPGRFGRGSSCPALLRQSATAGPCFAYGPLTRCGAAFQPLRPAGPAACAAPTTPRRPKPARFGLLPFRSPLLGESRLLSLPAATEMFQFAAFARPSGRARPSAGRVAPFGHPRVKGRVRLAGAFRSLPRPSSPPGARASTVRPASLPARSRRGPSRAPPPRAAHAVALASRSLLRFFFSSAAPGRPAGGEPARRPAPSKTYIVENVGFEPTAPGLQSRCSTAELIPRAA